MSGEFSDHSPGLVWLQGLPDDMAGQKALLQALVHWCQDDDDARWFAVGCSLARGNGDALSDIDGAIGFTDGSAGTAAERLVGAVSEWPGFVALYVHLLRSPHFTVQRLFAQFADRTQLDLVLAELANSNMPGAVVLYDPGQVVTTVPPQPLAPTSDAASEWYGQLWEAVANIGKYARRGPVWEAHAQLEKARGHFWQLWALARQVRDPQYGITSILDFTSPPDLPDGAARTVAGLDLVEIVVAAIELAGLALRLGQMLPMAPLLSPLGQFVMADLRKLPAGR